MTILLMKLRDEPAIAAMHSLHNLVRSAGLLGPFRHIPVNFTTHIEPREKPEKILSSENRVKLN